MIKGLFVGLAIVVVLAVIPVVHFVGVPAGPFIAGYFGINVGRDQTGNPGRRALIFGIWMGVFVAAITAVAAMLVTLAGNFAYPLLLWGGVVVATFYYSSMSALGAWYSELRASEQANAATVQGSAVDGTRR
ncbi:hypothetical protein GBAR_LOCUS2422 [Geodia barretti]|uniref:Uncharacterized protein n=1 Tax=Geodia barretti TaxID=519541 RepID=A0AA35W6T3_GEOBA|nr:hypothetical protein GBAR_LOCUS2422 [Geodia barretti]